MPTCRRIDSVIRRLASAWAMAASIASWREHRTVNEPNEALRDPFQIGTGADGNVRQVLKVGQRDSLFQPPSSHDAAAASSGFCFAASVSKSMCSLRSTSGVLGNLSRHGNLRCRVDDPRVAFSITRVVPESCLQVGQVVRLKRASPSFGGLEHILLSRRRRRGFALGHHRGGLQQFAVRLLPVGSIPPSARSRSTRSRPCYANRTALCETACRQPGRSETPDTRRRKSGGTTMSAITDHSAAEIVMHIQTRRAL